MDQVVIDMISAASLTVAVFGVVFCLLQHQFVWVYRSFALFLMAIVLTELSSTVAPILRTSEAVQTQIMLEMIWLLGLVCIPPLFWNYVCALTTTTPKWPRRLWAHGALPAVALILVVIVALSPKDIRIGLLMEGVPLPQGWPYAVAVVGELTVIAAAVQLGVYIVLMTRRLMTYRLRLRDLFASTARRELTWIFVLMGLATLYWLVVVVDLVLDMVADRTVLAPVPDAALSFALLSATALWGLRQRPGLVPDAVVVEPAAIEQGVKYEKSALTAEAAARIERKLRAAMEQDQLHRDPNLSLWALARHIGASPNYISQTLNGLIGESFFDFVNGYRIEEAKQRLRDTDETVLAITYDVGFNARSSFYTAFGRVTGQTPTAYRKTVSERTRPDDTATAVADT